MNFVFISPHFPENYYLFCQRLRENGVTVLGIGDTPFEALDPRVKASLDDYCQVWPMEDFDRMARALGYFTWRWGKLDWLESNNEYWLQKDAALREAFHITTGLQPGDMPRFKQKSAMKAFFEKAGVPTARYHMVSDPAAGKAFAARVGYPVIVKPDDGVGAEATYKLTNEAELERFYQSKPPVPYIMEEFVDGEVTSFDGVADGEGRVLFSASHVTPGSIMDMVNEHLPVWYYVSKAVPDDVADAGRRCLAAFGVKSRCFHLEFFRLKTPKPGLGQAGGLVALEVNMRPAGGFTPDMINYSQQSDLYKIWADMAAFGRTDFRPQGEGRYCLYTSRRDGEAYRFDDGAVSAFPGADIKMSGRMPLALARAMGDRMWISCFDTYETMTDFVRFVHQRP